MSTLTGYKIDEKLDTTDDNDSDGFAHYFKKKDVENAIFNGGFAIALCGRKDRPMGSVADKETCPKCKDFYNFLQD